VIGNDGANEFYEEINIVDATSEIESPRRKTERLAGPAIEALISFGANLWTAQFGCEIEKSTLTGM
jgi:hypothetical protein